MKTKILLPLAATIALTAGGAQAQTRGAVGGVSMVRTGASIMARSNPNALPGNPGVGMLPEPGVVIMNGGQYTPVRTGFNPYSYQLRRQAMAGQGFTVPTVTAPTPFLPSPMVGGRIPVGMLPQFRSMSGPNLSTGSQVAGSSIPSFTAPTLWSTSIPQGQALAIRQMQAVRQMQAARQMQAMQQMRMRAMMGR